MKKKVLVLAHRIPYPPDKGDKIRTWHMLQHLAQHYRVTLICLIDDPNDCQYVPVLRQIVQQVHYLVRTPKTMRLHAGVALITGRSFSQECFYASALQQAFDDYLATQTPAAILCFCSTMADYVFRSHHWPQRFREITLLDDLIDVDSEKWLQYAEKKNSFTRWLYRREARLVRALEQRIVSEFGRVFLVSEEEKEVLGKYMPVDKVEALSNGVDLDYFSLIAVELQHFTTAPCKLVFSGAMDYWPNIEGAVWFAEQIFPLVRQQVPAASFCIAGRNPAPTVRALEKIPGVEVTGTVADMRAYLASATICVVPLLIARGIQNKILEAMAMERPVVATRGAATGTCAVDGEELLIVDDAKTMAAAIVDLLHDETRRREMGRKARAYVEREHSWASHLQRLSKIIDTTATH